MSKIFTITEVIGMIGTYSPVDRDKLAAAIQRWVESGKSQRDLARAAEVSDTAISNYVSKLRGPSPAVLARLADVLGVSIIDLMKDD